MANLLLYLAFLLCISYVSSTSVPPGCTSATCPDIAHCKPVVSWEKDDREVIIATDGSDKDYEGWMWESITTVLQLGDVYHPEVMCYTHSKGRKYGFFIDMIVNYDPNSSELKEFIESTLHKDIYMHNADVLALDLLNILGSCNNTENHINQITGVVLKVIGETKTAYPNLKILCVMPWKPPCYEYNCGVTPALQPYCDGIIISPESFTTYCSQSCRARATVPFTKLFLGLDEYEASGVEKNQLILGIPWHGYNYTCEKFVNNSASAFDQICGLKYKMVNRTVGTEVKEVQVCDVEGSRQKVPIGQYFEEQPSLLMDTKIYSRSQQAPSVSGRNGNGTHMIWYEDYASLAAKYSVVYNHGIKGCIIYTGDDLRSSHTDTGNQLNSKMWSWLLHTVLATSTHEYTKDTCNVAGWPVNGPCSPSVTKACTSKNGSLSVVAIAVICVVGGLLLIVVIASVVIYIGRRKRSAIYRDRHQLLTTEDDDDDDVKMII